MVAGPVAMAEEAEGTNLTIYDYETNNVNTNVSKTEKHRAQDEHDHLRLEFLALESSVKAFLMGFFIFMRTEDGLTLYDARTEESAQGSCSPCVDGHETSPHDNHKCIPKPRPNSSASSASDTSGCTEVRVIGPIALDADELDHEPHATAAVV